MNKIVYSAPIGRISGIEDPWDSWKNTLPHDYEKYIRLDRTRAYFSGEKYPKVFPKAEELNKPKDEELNKPKDEELNKPKDEELNKPKAEEFTHQHRDWIRIGGRLKRISDLYVYQ